MGNLLRVNLNLQGTEYVAWIYFVANQIFRGGNNLAVFGDPQIAIVYA